MTKRQYKLTKAQKKSALKYYKEGVTTQIALARKLVVSKQKVANFLREKQLGVRAKGEFWKDVKVFQRVKEESWSVSRKAVFNQPYWARKRAKRQKKEYKSYRDFWREWKEKWRDATQEERDKHGYEAAYGEEGEFVGGTPH